jgi:predicted YcjX-like family ATPase
MSRGLSAAPRGGKPIRALVTAAVRAYLACDTTERDTPALVIASLADSLVRGAEQVGDTVSELVFEPVIRLGVTGLARAGKTVFITSLVANLLDRGRMTALAAARDGRISAAYLQPQPDDTVPRFDFERHLAALTAADPHWPDSTRAVSELRLSLRVRPTGLIGGMTGPRTVHLDIVDYPGEWLLDLGLMDTDYAGWSADVLDRIAARPEASGFLEAMRGTDAGAALDEPSAQDLAERYAAYLHAARAAGYSDCTPGRFLLPGDLAGSPALTFAPMPRPEAPGRRSLWRAFERRFEAYKAKVAAPFFRSHFSRIDRQIVLVDLLDAIHAGPQAVEDLRRSMAAILEAFRPGRTATLARLLGVRRVERILFAATKADHLHHTQHGRLAAIAEALLRDARDRARFAGASTEAMAIAALRATTEEMRVHDGRELPCVRGRLLETGREAAFYPGALPEDPSALLDPARMGAEGWLDAEFGAMTFAPAPQSLRPGDGPPHIRLDRAAQFLFGDRL